MTIKGSVIFETKWNEQKIDSEQKSSNVIKINIYECFINDS